jgi:hypothetical protein
MCQHLSMFKNVNSSVSDPDPGSVGSVDPDPDQDPDLERAKWPTKKGKNEEISCCEELNFFSGRLKPFPKAWSSYIL